MGMWQSWSMRSVENRVIRVRFPATPPKILVEQGHALTNIETHSMNTRKCLSCNNKIPLRMFIDGKQRLLKNRKYCLDCSPFGARNTRILDPEVRKTKGLDSPDCICSDCGRQYVYKREGHTKTTCNSCLTKKRRVNGETKAYIYKGSECAWCGYNNCLQALHFHHIDPATKAFNISGNTQRKWEVLKLELDKCVLLCSIHHTELECGLLSIADVMKKQAGLV